MLCTLYMLALLWCWRSSFYAFYGCAHTFMWLHKNYILFYSVYNLVSYAVL